MTWSPAARSCAISVSTMAFSPDGAAAAYRLCATTTLYMLTSHEIAILAKVRIAHRTAHRSAVQVRIAFIHRLHIEGSPREISQDLRVLVTRRGIVQRFRE